MGKYLAVILCIVCVLFLVYGCFEETKAKNTGTINGRVSPDDISIRIIAKKSGTDYQIEDNIKGEITLATGGEFSIEKLSPGTYDLLFFLQGESKEKYIANRWGEIIVEAGKITSGINYRLTPKNSNYNIDEVLVAFENTKVEDAQKTIRLLGCTIKDKPTTLGQLVLYLVDIPDDKSVGEMISMFVKEEGVQSAEPNGISTIN